MRSSAESAHRRCAGSATGCARNRVRRPVVLLGSDRRRRRGGSRFVGARSAVGMLLRNRPAHVAAFLGVLLSGGTVVTINPSRGDERTRADIAALRLPLVFGESEDLTTLVATTAGTETMSISGISGPVRRGGDARSSAALTAPGSGVAVRMLTSGTTGPPKRIDLSYDMLAHSVMGRELSRRVVARPSCAAGWRSSTRRWCTSAACSGCCNASPRRDPFVLLERFELQELD